MDERQRLLPSEVRLSERNQTNMEELLLSDLTGEDSLRGSTNVYALSTNREGVKNGSWKALCDALWRTPYVDYADEWISTTMLNTKQFLVRSFNKMVKNSNNGRRFNMILINDINWPAYDRLTAKTPGEIHLTG